MSRNDNLPVEGILHCGFNWFLVLGLPTSNTTNYQLFGIRSRWPKLLLAAAHLESNALNMQNWHLKRGAYEEQGVFETYSGRTRLYICFYDGPLYGGIMHDL